ncbi:hypothetical protein PGAL8A_00450600 [Plasmodium gallinaceum]|uniref:Plasmodium RESA N-terminal domain-containing protein n=1 Tax=Plasmodium gallinaceum TaxID=5849 RepID=A0A1J1H0X3_PLAGA|nr:hypothetical protein PGAL8A_00450600 [Plasmodium gallinaceum]CRG96925.1 hypothetical protein PGAL8A_00450600 [Plasmodium gallinaceum]
MLFYWENVCFDLGVRYSLFGREWEQENFNHWYNKISDDIKDFNDKVLAEYTLLWESCPNDKECSTFFKKKKKELSKVCKVIEDWFRKYVKKCEDEWNHFNNKNVPTFYNSIFKYNKINYKPLINNLE